MNKSREKNVYLIAIVSKILIVFLSLFTSALVNRQLGVALKGEYAYIINIVSIVVIISCLGLGQTYSTFRREYGKDLLKYFLSLTIIHALISVFFGIVLLLFNNKMWGIIFILTSSGILKTNVLYYAAIEDVKKRDINNILYKIIYLLIIVFYYFFMQPSVTTLLIFTLIEDLIIIYCTMISFKFKPSLKNIKDVNIKKIYKLGFLCMVMHCLMSLNYNLDIIFLKKMTTSDMVGLYSVGVTLANMLWLIPDAFKDVLVSKTSREDSIREIVKVTRFSLIFSIFLIFLFILFGNKFIVLMYGNEFVNSYQCTVVLFIGCLSMIIYKLVHPIYIAKGKQLIVVKVLFVSVLTNIVLNLLLIPILKIYGAALASVMSYSLCSIIFLIIFCKEYKVKMTDFIIIKKEDFNLIKKIIKR